MVNFVSEKRKNEKIERHDKNEKNTHWVGKSVEDSEEKNEPRFELHLISYSVCRENKKKKYGEKAGYDPEKAVGFSQPMI